MVINNENKLSLLIYCLVSFIFSCSNPSNNSSTNNPINTTLFEILPDSITHITFNNKLTENIHMNGLNYDYMYNGAGVSAADFNNDGLTDLYFISNQNNNKLFLNKGNLEFKDITKASNTKGKLGFSLASTVVDINHDGFLDIYICKSGPFTNPEVRKNELYINKGLNDQGIPIFKEEANLYQLDLPHYSTQAAFFDYDKDGDLDLFLINHNTNTNILYASEKQQNIKSPLTSDRLFKNENNKFIDVSEEAGLINDAIGFGLGIAIGDLNNDNWPDILVSQDFKSKDRIYLNQKNGSFKEVLNESTGHISNFSMGNDIADFNNDGWLDFMSLDMVSEDNYGIKASMSGMNPERFNKLVEKGFHHQYMYNTLQLNNGVNRKTNTPLFSDIASLSRVSNTDWSWGPLFFDMDNDGDKDLFISNGVKRDFRNVDFIHYRQKKEAEYAKKIKEAPENVKLLLEQQRDEDILRRMPPRKKDNYFFENKGDLAFKKRNTTWSNKKLTATNGATYADLDNDGDLDIITNNMDDSAFIYKNNTSDLNLGNFIKIKLKGSLKNLNGIGTRITLKTKNEKQTLEQNLSRGFQSSIDPILHFGIGKSKTIDTIEIKWPDNRTQILTQIKGNQIYEVNHTNSVKNNYQLFSNTPTFEDITDKTGITHFSKQNIFDDFEKERLLPHKMSEEGVALAVGDVNNDNLEDFYIGGTKGYPGALYIQNKSGRFKASNSTLWNKEKRFEDTDAIFLDIDNDNDLDLYVVSGGNEFSPNSKNYSDRIYLNSNGQFSKAKNIFPTPLNYSGSVVRPYDFDKDGDVDLFVGGRQSPGNYPLPGQSILLKNESTKNKIKFIPVENESLKNIGMVTDATWVDVDGDNAKDLILTGEWMPITIFKNKKGKLVNKTKQSGLEKNIGWWFSLEPADFDGDGDLDLIVGNLGLNSKYKASTDKPFQVYAKDFDNTGSLDIVLSFQEDGKNYPLRGRECSSQQMPFIKQKFPRYHDFALAQIDDIFGKENIDLSLQYKVNNFANSYIENKGDGTFNIKDLPITAQTTAIKSAISYDINKDGNLDVLLFGNIYGFEVETPRQDSGYGLYLQGDSKNNFKSISNFESYLQVKGEVVNVKKIKIKGSEEALLIAKNNNFLQLLKIE